MHLRSGIQIITTMITTYSACRQNLRRIKIRA